MASMPLIPGYTFHNPLIQDFKLKQKFGYTIHGYPTIKDSFIGIGGKPVDAASSAYVREASVPFFDPGLTYGRRKQSYRQFIPHFALYSQKCLLFKAYFRQAIFSAPEHFRVRYVNIVYYLEDDTIKVSEPRIDNVGYAQGRLVTRSKIVKSSNGDYYTWKDMNVAIDIAFYGVIYRIYKCDDFTREWLTSMGIDVNEPEDSPTDPYLHRRATEQLSIRKPSKPFVDIGKRFLEYDGMILVFDATWNDEPYKIMYYLADDTVSVREVHVVNDGKEPNSLLLKKTMVPKNWKQIPPNYPAVCMERGDAEVVEYYAPKDLIIGETIFIFGRRFLLHDCDSFTRKYYSTMLGVTQPEKIPMPSKEPEVKIEFKIPPAIPFGTHEDTLFNCNRMEPREPRRDVAKQLYFFPKKLRYCMTMDAVHPEDDEREFVLDYRLSDETVAIHELPRDNSGRTAGCFLQPMRVPVPGYNKDDPVYYTPKDFCIGKRINIFNHHFNIVGADFYVYKYLQEHKDEFDEELLRNMHDYFKKKGFVGKESEPKAEDEPDNSIEVACPSKKKVSFNEHVETCMEELTKDPIHDLSSKEEIREKRALLNTPYEELAPIKDLQCKGDSEEVNKCR